MKSWLWNVTNLLGNLLLFYCFQQKLYVVKRWEITNKVFPLFISVILYYKFLKKNGIVYVFMFFRFFCDVY